MFCFFSSRAIMAVCAVGLFFSSTQAQVLRPLMPVSGADQSYAQSVNDLGWAAGYSTQGGYETPTVWKPYADGYVAEALPTIPGLEFGGANSIAANGWIAGYVQPSDGETASAMVWKPSDNDAYLPMALPSTSNGIFTSAYAINMHGQVVGQTDDEDFNAQALTWLYDAETAAYTVRELPDAGSPSVAAGINRHGAIAGYITNGYNIHGAVWRTNAQGAYVRQTVVAADLAVVTAINDHGVGAGVYSFERPLVMAHFEDEDYAFDLPPYDTSSGVTNSANNFDVIVGYLHDPATATGGPEAAAWLPTEGFWDFVNLDSWLNQTDPVLGAQWTLTDAWSISDTALVAGEGLFDADGPGGAAAVERAFLLDISSIVPASGVFGDFNHDASFTSADIDLLSAQIRSGQFHPLFDVNGDQQLDSSDLTYEVESILYTVFGDTDTDGDVGLSDLGNLATYYGMTSGALWSQGDQDADGDVDLADLGLLATNYDHGAAQAAIDFQTLTALPDPAGTGLACVALFHCLRRIRPAAYNKI